MLICIFKVYYNGTKIIKTAILVELALSLDIFPLSSFV